MGSRLRIEMAYIAGFLDGDGSLMLQIKKRKDIKSGIRFMATICFYQDSRHSEPLTWIQEKLSTGYISHRNDGMSELRINGFSQIKEVLSDLSPFIRFKKVQAQALLKACTILEKKRFSSLNEFDLRLLVDCIVEIQSSNYVAKHKKTKNELLMILGLTP